MHTLPRTFTSAQAGAFAGATPRQVRYWDHIGFVVPSVKGTGGRPGAPRIYARPDVLRLAAVVELLSDGWSVQRIRGTDAGAAVLRETTARLADREDWRREFPEFRAIVAARRWAA